MTDRNAFVFRIAPNHVGRVDEALREGQLIIGWARASELMDSSLEWQEFREILSRHYYPNEKNLRRAGSAAGNMWRFLREMKRGDLVVTPHGPHLYVGELKSDEATHNPALMDDDSAFRRSVCWLLDGQPIPRSLARAALQSRMKVQGTCAYAADLIEEIDEVVRLARAGNEPTFEEHLKLRLIDKALNEIRTGPIDSYRFEQLVKGLLDSLGADESRIVARQNDKGADILATFVVAGAFQLVVAIQAKHFQAEPPIRPEVIDQTIRGIEAESANLGMVVTSGSFSDEAAQAANEYFEESGIKIELVDGPQLASLLVERGLRIA